MYGTIARFRLKAGMEDRLSKLMKEFEGATMPGALADYLYKSDENPNEYYMAVVFEDKASYMANADSPEQDARYREWLELLDGEPEWHDGGIVYHVIYKQPVATGYGGWEFKKVA
jgi:quinol monooxygenase YgiN